MFQTGRHHVVALSEHAEQGEVQRFGTVFGKDDAFKSVTVEEFGKQIAAGKHPLCAGDGEGVPAPSGVGAYLGRGKHGADDSGGLFAARRGVIEIDHIPIYTKVRKQS